MNYGFKKGDVLGLFVPNDIDVPPVVLGTLWTGGIVSPANPGYTVAELVYQLKDSGAKVVVTHMSVLETARKACREAGIPESHIMILGSQRDASRKFKHWTLVRNLEGTARYRTPKISPKTDLAFLVYSSGTTGRPKGVRLTHYNMTSNLEQVHAAEPWVTWDGSRSVPGIPDAPKGQGDRILACLPFFHIYGLNCLVLSPIFTGARTLVMSRFDLEKWCRTVQEQRITFSYIVPPIVLLLCKAPVVEKYDLSSLRMTNSGAAPLTRDLVENLFKRKGVRCKQGYGLSETSPTIFVQRWQDWMTTVGSTGWLVPNVQAKFCAVPGPGEESDGSRELPRGQTGELYVKGPNVFGGYHNNPTATAECLEDGWFRTGDVGFMDEAGNLTITDRVKELIKYKGEFWLLPKNNQICGQSINVCSYLQSRLPSSPRRTRGLPGRTRPHRRRGRGGRGLDRAGHRSAARVHRAQGRRVCRAGRRRRDNHQLAQLARGKPQEAARRHQVCRRRAQERLRQDPPESAEGTGQEGVPRGGGGQDQVKVDGQGKVVKKCMGFLCRASFSPKMDNVALTLCFYVCCRC